MSAPSPATIILLNGVGSAGKSSIAKALQRVARRPFLHVEMDAFLAMLPEALLDSSEGYRFETVLDEGMPSVVIHEGPAGARLIAGMRGAVAALAAAGNDLVLDEVLVEGGLGSYAALLAPFTLHLVGVHCPLPELEARERARGDRMPGLARWQYPRVHRHMAYDLDVDTGRATPEQCAAAIKARFGL